jgi:hypothetical protein
LTDHGYSRVHSRIQLRLVGHFNRWLENKHLTAEQLDEDVIECYRLYLKRRKRVRSEDVCTFVRLLGLLREHGVTPGRNIQTVPTARETLLEKYRRYLREERGLSEASLRNMLMFVDRFLAEKYPKRPFRFCRANGWRHHNIRSTAGDRAEFGTGQTTGYSAPQLFPIPTASRRDR